VQRLPGAENQRTEKSIPALAALLTHAETSHAARVALEAMSYPAAGAALREAAGKATGLARAGIFDSLGERRDAEAVPLLASALEDKDPVVVTSAAIALGKIGSVESARALAAGRAKRDGDARAKLSAALVACADRLLAAGQREEAAKIYRELAQPAEPRIVRAGALRGVMQTAPEGAKTVIDGLSSDDPWFEPPQPGRYRTSRPPI